MSTKTFLPTKQNAKILGRYLYEDDVLWMTSSASTVEFNVEAKSLSFTLVGDDSARTDENGFDICNCVRFSIFMNDELYCTQTMNSPEKTVTVFSSNEVRKAKVTFVKITESHQSYIGLKSINTDPDGKICPTPAKEKFIEFIGDSITCGYGVEDNDPMHHFTTFTENATRAYAYLLAKKLDMDYTMVSYSGFGIYSGWTDDPTTINGQYILPNYYDKVCFNWNTKRFEEREWDHSTYNPNLIIINLGTNDASYCIDDERKQSYVDYYVNFLDKVHTTHPDAYILMTVGLMTGGDALWESLDKACNIYKEKSGNQKVSSFHIAHQTEAEGYGADYHPSIASQVRAADDLFAHIKTLGLGL